MKIFITLLCTMALAATFVLAQAPPAKAPSVPVAPVLPVVDAASITALTPLATQRATLQAQLRTLIDQLNSVNASWRIQEGKALAAAGLDPGQYGAAPVTDATGKVTGIKFTQRNGPPTR